MKTLELWETTPDFVDLINNVENIGNLDPNIYIPTSLRLNNIKLKLQGALHNCDDYQNQIENIKNEFEQAKNKFKLIGSKCAKEIAQLKLAHARTSRCKNITKQFTITLIHYITYHRDRRIDTVNSTKSIPVLAACILVDYINELPQEFFNWAEIDKTTFQKFTRDEIGDTDLDVNLLIQTPILHTERTFASKISEEFLAKTFIPMTMEISIIHTQNKREIADRKLFGKIIKNYDTEQITAATREGLDNANLEETQETLENILNKRDKNLQSAISKQLKDHLNHINQTVHNRNNTAYRNTSQAKPSKKASGIRQKHHSKQAGKRGHKIHSKQKSQRSWNRNKNPSPNHSKSNSNNNNKLKRKGNHDDTKRGKNKGKRQRK